MYAIVKAGGRQLRVAPQETVKIDRLPQTVGDGVEFTQVLAVSDGVHLTVGAPYVPNAKVTGRIVRQGKDPKIRVRTFRRKKRTQRHLGHRQPHTLVEIISITTQ
jgi:large subunit ribosomal protein L21